MGRSFEDLKAIAAAWQIPLPQPNHNDTAITLYREMAEKTNTRAIWETLTGEQRAFLAWLLEQRSIMAFVDELPAALDRPAEEVERLLGSLAALGLVDVEEAAVRGNRLVSAGDNLYAWGLRSQVPITRRRVVSMSGELSRTLGAVVGENTGTAPFEEPLAALLEHHDQPTLEKIAARWHISDLRYMHRPALVEALATLLGAQETRERMVNEAGSEAHRLYDYLASRGGQAESRLVQTALGWSLADLRARLIPLEARALVVEALWHDRAVLFLPAEFLKPRSQTAPEVPDIRPAGNPAAVDTRLPVELPWDLLSTLAFFMQGDVALNLHNNELPKRALKRLNEQYLHPDDPERDGFYIGMVLHFADSLSLLHVDEATRRMSAGPRAVDWVKLSFGAQARRLFALWLEDRRWFEPTTQFYIWRTPDPTRARKQLVAHLRECPLDTWVSLDSFLSHVQAKTPYLLYTQDELVRYMGVAALRDFTTRWMSNEGALLVSMLTTTLFWLGAVDIGRDAAGTPVAFRLTGAGARLIEHAAAPAEAEPPRRALLVQPNFEVLVMHPDSRAVWHLLLSADLVRHDRVSVYVLSKASVLRARESGLNGPQIQEFLATHSQKAVPQNVVQSITDWSRSYKRAILQKATLLEVEDSEILDEIIGSRRFKPFVARRLSPTTAVLRLPRTTVWTRDDPWQKLSKELRAAGYFPEIEEEQRVAEKPKSKKTADRDPANPPPPRRPRTPAANGTNGTSANGTNGTGANGTKRAWRKRPSTATS
jgi:hypothetical protein